MKLVTVNSNNYAEAGVVVGNRIYLVKDLEIFKERLNLGVIIKSGRLETLIQKFSEIQSEGLDPEIGIPVDQVKYLPPYLTPEKIWGIGLNYQEHASDLVSQAPKSYPVGFMKPITTIIGHGDEVKIPLISNKTTGEAELGIIIGQDCENVSEGRWLDYVAGFCCVIDMTAEDILRQNTRYLSLSKVFDTFFSFGPEITTKDEIRDVNELEVSTIHNGKIYASNSVSNMRFPPAKLISFYSSVMSLKRGDIISTGTPRAVPLAHGDTIECSISGFTNLCNPVVDKKILDSNN